MKIIKSNGVLASLVMVAFTLSSCEAIGDIFQAGMWVGVFVVVIIVALVLWLIRKVKR
jgi:TRAP-type C4-dicarboxylate transport system permease large subunit